MALVRPLNTEGLTCDGDPDDDVVRGVGLHGAQVLAGVSLRHRADHQHPVIGPLSADNTLISHIILSTYLQESMASECDHEEL